MQHVSPSSTKTIRCAIYLRVSLDATGEHLAVTRQREDCLKIAGTKGWTVVAEYVDNSVSASDKKKDRPEYNRMVAAHAAGEFDALVTYDLDRLTRQPRQLEDWIDAAEEHGLKLVTANGEADLTTDGGRLFARIKASVARAEVERKSARQKRAAVQRAEHGRTPKGVRLTGYAVDGTIIEAEAVTVKAMFERFLSGDSLHGITVWLNDSGATSRNGAQWNPSTVRTILLNARYAGHSVYCGELTGRAGDWTPIIDQATFTMVGARLTDPRRRTQVGTDRKHLGSGLFRCGAQGCDRAVRSHSGCRYRCAEGGHLTRMAASIDEYVLGVLRGRLAKPDLAGLIAEPSSAKASDLKGQIKVLRGRLAEIEADYDAGRINGLRFQVATEKVAAELATVESAQLRLLASSSVAGIIAASDPVTAFDAAPLGAQREVLDFFFTVTLKAAQRGYKFNPQDGTVKFTWKR